MKPTQEDTLSNLRTLSNETFDAIQSGQPKDHGTTALTILDRLIDVMDAHVANEPVWFGKLSKDDSNQGARTAPAPRFFVMRGLNGHDVHERLTVKAVEDRPISRLVVHSLDDELSAVTICELMNRHAKIK